MAYSQITQRLLALSVVDALRIWTDDRYRRCLPTKRAFDATWFDDFLRTWGVARTVRKEKQSRLLAYFNGRRFRDSITQDKDGTAITAAAKELASKGWTHRHRIPLSLVSKIAFFLRPERYVPLDGFSLRGLRNLSGARLASRRYEHYLNAFNRVFDDNRVPIRTATTSDWATALAGEMGCRPTVLRSPAFRHKVLDNVLMRLGGRGR